MTRLTVSIVNYRTAALTCECIASIKAHPPTDVAVDIVVVDNASGDGSGARIAAAHPDVRLIESDANLGFAGGNNLVLRDCGADYVLLLNSDACVEAGTLDTLLTALRDHPRVGAVSGRIVNAGDGLDQDYPCCFPSLPEMVRRALRGAQFPAAGQTEPVPLERLHGACMMLRGELLATVGVLDDGFFMYDEDVDWCVRATRQGWALWLIPAARVVHHGGKSSERAPSGQRRGLELSATALRMRYELRRSRYRLYRKHRAWWELCLLKAMTDAAMLLACVRPFALWLAVPSQRAAAGALLRVNLRIVAMNPFADGDTARVA